MIDTKGCELAKQKKLPKNGGITKLLRGTNQQVAVAIEATHGWYWPYALLQNNEIEAKFSHPLKTKVVASAKVKNDKVDSRILARLLHADFRPLSYVPAISVQIQTEFLRYPASLIRIQTLTKK